MSACRCSLAGTAACRTCSNNPFADTQTPIGTHTTWVTDPVLITGQKTNADRVRRMTDEELAETYAGGCPNGDRLNCGKHYLHGGRDCFNCWLDWLKAPVEGGEG